MSELILSNLGITKCSDVIEKAAEILISFKEGAAHSLISSCLGIARCYHE